MPESESVTGSTRPIDLYLERLASADPTPGGGSASAYTGALGMALVTMVAELTRHPPNETVAASLRAIVAATTQDRLLLMSLAWQDEQVYARYRAAAALPKSTEPEKVLRRVALQDALIGAAQTPLKIAGTACRGLEHAASCTPIGTVHALSDIRTARHLLNAAIAGAIENVEVNVALIKDESVKNAIRVQIESIQTTAAAVNQTITRELTSRQTAGT